MPPLHPKPPGLALRTIGLFVPGIRKISSQIAPYTEWWSEQNQTALDGDGPMLAVIGDSTAIGIGASSPEHGYIGRLRTALETRDDRPWRVVNVAQSGARVADGLERQLPIIEQLHQLDQPPTVTLSVIGTNDVVWSADTTVLRERLRKLIAGLPEGAIVGLVAGASPRARVANRAVRKAATEHGMTVIDPWREPGPPPQARLASDRFHPNDIGHALMARPFARQLEAPEPQAPEHRTDEQQASE